MSEALRSSGKHVRLAMAGVAAMLLGGCAELESHGRSFRRSLQALLRTIRQNPYGNGQSAAGGRQPSARLRSRQLFLRRLQAFRCATGALGAAARRPRAGAPRIRPPSRSPFRANRSPRLHSPHRPILFTARPRPSRRPRSCVHRPTPWADGRPKVACRWSSDKANPLQSIATRYGVPTATLLAINGYANRSQVTPGSRLTIPVYHASGAVRAAAAPAPIAAPAAPRAQLAEAGGAQGADLCDEARSRHGAG